MSRNEALLILKEIKENNPETMENLRNKCRWEQMTQIEVIIKWGDPRNW